MINTKKGMMWKNKKKNKRKIRANKFEQINIFKTYT